MMKNDEYKSVFPAKIYLQNGRTIFLKAYGELLDSVSKRRFYEVQSQLFCAWEFFDVIEEMFPDEFEKAYEEYKKRNKIKIK